MLFTIDKYAFFFLFKMCILIIIAFPSPSTFPLLNLQFLTFIWYMDLISWSINIAKKKTDKSFSLSFCTNIKLSHTFLFTYISGKERIQ